MKKITSYLTIAVALVVIATGCLKDKDFEAQRYGLQIAEVKGVAFPGASSSPLSFGLDVSASPQVINDLLYLTLEINGVAETDVVVTLTNTTGTSSTPGPGAGDIAAHNTATGENVQVLPAGIYTVPLTVTIPAGQKNLMIPITVNNTTGLNPNLAYGIGLTISSATAGYQVAANMRNVVIIFSVKNAYDGKYTLRGQFYHPSAAPGYPWYTANVEMITTGPNSVKMYFPAFGGYYHPWSGTTGGPLTAFAAQEPEYTVNSATNLITVQNTAPGAVTFYNMGAGFNNAGYTSRWDPATKTMYANFGYNMVGSTFDPAISRMWIDTLVRTGPR